MIEKIRLSKIIHVNQCVGNYAQKLNINKYLICYEHTLRIEGYDSCVIKIFLSVLCFKKGKKSRIILDFGNIPKKKAEINHLEGMKL